MTAQNWPIQPRELDKSAWDERARIDNNWMWTQAGEGDWPKHHCKQTWKAALPFLKLDFTRNTLAVDVGTRDGEFTRYLLRGYARVAGFEPRARSYFDRNLPVSEHPRVKLFQCALGDREGEIEMAGGGHDFARTKKRGKHPCFRLDQFSLGCVDLIKIDVEGYEERVLRGAKNTVLSYKPVIIVERNQVSLPGEDPDGALKLLTSWGYRLAATCPRGWDHIMVPDA